ncbi:MAG TPA: ABC transporter permease [Gemmatimonadaceae bacterium]|nr:ABC transporter permease [Gemmatimonadaceae bacterium]
MHVSAYATSVQPASLGGLRSAAAEVAGNRELFYSLVRRELALRYRHAPIGVAWALFMPLLTTVIFSLVFTRVVRLDTAAPYPVFAYSGLLAWHFFASTLRAASTSLSAHGSLITKVYFPRELLPLSSLVTALADFAVGAVVLGAMMAVFGIRPTVALVFLPVVIGVQVAFTAGLAFLLALGNALYRDLRHVVEVVLTLWMYATAVLYPVDRIGGIIGGVLQVNPMTVIVEAHRSVLLYGELPATLPFALTALLSVLVLAGGWLVFHRGEGDLAERI